MAVKTIEFRDNAVYLLDQTRLPRDVVVLELRRAEEVVEAITSLRIRGAPAIGVAGAYALVLASLQADASDVARFMASLWEAARSIGQARPTAVNLQWALQRLLRVSEGASTPEEARRRLLEEARKIQREDEEADRLIGVHGAPLIPQGGVVLTHCNTGALATAGQGTAFGILRTAWQQGRLRHVYATETRPVMQGSRLTAWELVQEGIPASLIVDSAAGTLMAQGKVDCVIVGADRIAANGDVANKIGTYTLAVLAREHGIPFYVAAPISSVDLSVASGEAIPIEERPAWEVTYLGGQAIAPEGIGVYNPAFDVTPHRLVTAIVTERGVVLPPFEEGLR
ncbi:MAG: S-methyl-5-thioribose-1-phosphate isomerase [Dehalococcoidia bacterium]|nr:S-methyl-5-thioribose-1-phosphate isomerase [Dehalococcoidia bacterium]